MIYLIPTNTCFWIWCRLDDYESYNQIYKIKKRSYQKPLAIMVENFKWLEENTILNQKQIEDLKNYKKPFTILTQAPYVKMLLELQDEKDNYLYENTREYEKIAFRVAHNEIQKKLVKKVWPIFLTSANFSWKPEIYSVENLEKTFWKFKNIKNLCEKNIEKNPPSEIFEYIWDSLEKKYLRK